MNDLDDLIQIEHNILNARDLIGLGILGKISFHIMNSKTDSFQLLTQGQLQEVQNAHPKKIYLALKAPSVIFMNGRLIKLYQKRISP